MSHYFPIIRAWYKKCWKQKKGLKICIVREWKAILSHVICSCYCNYVEKNFMLNEIILVETYYFFWVILLTLEMSILWIQNYLILELLILLLGSEMCKFWLCLGGERFDSIKPTFIQSPQTGKKYLFIKTF